MLIWRLGLHTFGYLDLYLGAATFKNKEICSFFDEMAAIKSFLCWGRNTFVQCCHLGVQLCCSLTCEFWTLSNNSYIADLSALSLTCFARMHKKNWECLSLVLLVQFPELGGKMSVRRMKSELSPYSLCPLSCCCSAGKMSLSLCETTKYLIKVY